LVLALTARVHSLDIRVRFDDLLPLVQRMIVHPHNLSGRLVGSLDGPSKTIVVEPLRVPATRPLLPAVAPEREPKRSEPAPERKPVPSRS